MAASPRVTVAVPTFNRPKILERCLTDLLRQIGADTEVYVSDDASDAETASVLARFEHPRLRKSRNCSNIGLFENFNHCLAEAAGEFIIFLSDDDSIDDDLISSCLNLLPKDDADTRNVALVAANRYLTITSDGQSRISEVESRLPTGLYAGDFLLEQFWRERISFQLCGMLFHTEALRKIGGFTTAHRYAGDVFTFAALFFNQRVGFISSPKSTYVIHPQSESTVLGESFRLRDAAAVFDRIIAKAKVELPNDRSESVAESAHRYMTNKYLQNTLDLYRSGVSRSRCAAAFFPVSRWMLAPGGRPIATTSTFVFDVLLPLWLKEFWWTSRRGWRRVIARHPRS